MTVLLEGSFDSCAESNKDKDLIRNKPLNNPQSVVVSAASTKEDYVCCCREIQAASGEWMNEFVRRPSRRRDNRVYVPAADIIKRTIRRSWTISKTVVMTIAVTGHFLVTTHAFFIYALRLAITTLAEKRILVFTINGLTKVSNHDNAVQIVVQINNTPLPINLDPTPRWSALRGSQELRPYNSLPRNHDINNYPSLVQHQANSKTQNSPSDISSAPFRRWTPTRRTHSEDVYNDRVASPIRLDVKENEEKEAWNVSAAEGTVKGRSA
ncbi:hypothetical protein NQ317_015938 [Molorchus minor]|uniref:Uncharacterized protein n=1 Tax=Molorchus minor TaxID=1323400 RepID=A0ABQ9JL24_9CUCU|nr:hypothetical protein NQ317_015938 [Molorchus minor]